MRTTWMISLLILFPTGSIAEDRNLSENPLYECYVVVSVFKLRIEKLENKRHRIGFSDVVPLCTKYRNKWYSSLLRSGVPKDNAVTQVRRVDIAGNKFFEGFRRDFLRP